MEKYPSQGVTPNFLGERRIKVVAMGGGTGLSTLLKGLKPFVNAGGTGCIGSLSAVVTVTDDGGSSGLLRRQFNILPPGDIRNCIVALSEDEALLSRLFQFRFPEDSGLQGHNFGNLFLTALNAMTGDFAEAVKLASEILASRGTIYPATTRANVQLEALMSDFSIVKGETEINASTKRIIELRLVPPDAQPLPQTLEAIAQADLITIGPGSLFTSLVPNLLVRGIPEAIAASSALKMFVCNLMTEANESLGLTVAGHIRALYGHAKRALFDVALVNSTPLKEEMKGLYAEEGADQIEVDCEAIEALGVRPVLGNYLDDSAGVARHASDRLVLDMLRLVALHHPEWHAPEAPSAKVATNVDCEQ